MKKSKFTEQQIAFIRSKPMSRYPLRIRNFPLHRRDDDLVLEALPHLIVTLQYRDIG